MVFKLISFATVRPSSPANYEASGKDFNFVLIEKENAPIKKETERLAMAKDSGKQFVSAAPSSGINTYYDRFCSAQAPVQMVQETLVMFQFQKFVKL